MMVILKARVVILLLLSVAVKMYSVRSKAAMLLLAVKAGARSIRVSRETPEGRGLSKE